VLPPLLYRALVPNLEMNSAYASWPWPVGRIAPLRPDAATTLLLLANGSIELAGPDADDDTTPANIVRGIPGMHIAVSN